MECDELKLLKGYVLYQPHCAEYSTQLTSIFISAILYYQIYKISKFTSKTLT